MKEKQHSKKKGLLDFIHAKDLPIVIMGEAKSINRNAVGNKKEFQRVDDEYFVIDDNNAIAYYFFASVLLLLALFFAVVDLKKGDVPVFAILIAVPAAFFIIYGFTMPNKEIILDRQNGLLTFPGHMWKKPVTIPFKEAKVTISSAGWPPSLTLEVLRPNKDGYATLTHYDQIETWNLFVWYMDKNRPLPPGSAFDAYRQRDYERRKAEGFPPPLYHSVIPTPEWVPGRGSPMVDNLN